MNFMLPVIAFLLTLILVPVLIPTLKKLKFGQSIREEGPKSHMKKTGTFLLATIVVTIIALFYVEQVGPLILLLFVTIGFGLIGFIDDYIIVVKKNNQGLTSKQKFFAQIGIAIVFYIVSILMPNYDFETAINIPFTDWSLPLSVFYIIFIVFWQVGFSNAVNLTDGLDGLSTGLSIIAFGFYAILSFTLDKPEIGLFCLVMLASLIGFLIYNKYPAKVFMGDTGSLALGGIFATISIMLNQEITLLFIGLVFVIETMSVMLQVTSFKLTGKRIFKMSPLHHHFELVGWSEWKIVLVFWTTGIITGAIGLWIGVM